MNSLLSRSRLQSAERSSDMSDLVTSDGVLLAFDTSSAVGSVAVGREGVVLAHSELEEQRKHASALVPAIRAVLLEAGIDKSELDGIVVGEGPGSFTGVRVLQPLQRVWCTLLGYLFGQFQAWLRQPYLSEGTE